MRTLSSLLRIELENRLSEIPGVLDAVGSFFGTLQHGGTALFDTTLALDELLSNIIRCAYPEGETHSIRLFLAARGDTLFCTLIDSGRAFDPLSLPPPDIDADIDTRNIGGLGVHFVRQVMKDVRYERVGGNNVLRMKHSLDAAEA